MSAPIVPFRPKEAPMADTPTDPDSSDVAAWRELDLVDSTAYSDAFFDDLANDIDAAVDDHTVVPLFRRPAALAIASVAAALLLGVLFLPGQLPSPSSDSDPTAALAEATDGLEELARQIGRSAATELFDEEVDSAGLFATADWLAIDEDSVPGTFGSLLEQLDDVPGSETDSLFTPL
ncbi:MAG: hypothetical protein KDA24_30045 [Deltaproteobacteria bacterium]|nr:hypothetical protein [Deltaproteobacteria bacterium]